MAGESGRARAPSSVPFTRELDRGIPVLALPGPVAARDLWLLDYNLRRLVLEADRGAVLDLTRVPYLPSQGFPLLLRTHLDLAGRGKRLLVAVDRELREYLEVLGLDQALELRGGREAALLEVLGGAPTEAEAAA